MNAPNGRGMLRQFATWRINNSYPFWLILPFHAVEHSHGHTRPSLAPPARWQADRKAVVI